jgi:hypothetical protein
VPAEQTTAELAYQRGVEPKQLLARGRQPNAPSRSAMKPSTATLIEEISMGFRRA